MHVNLMGITEGEITHGSADSAAIDRKVVLISCALIIPRLFFTLDLLLISNNKTMGGEVTRFRQSCKKTLTSCFVK
mgnify:CR=1 FL=1